MHLVLSFGLGLGLLLVEYLGPHRRAGIECEPLLVLHRDFPVVCVDIDLALVDANDILIRVNFVEAGLGETHPSIAHREDNVGLRAQLGCFDRGFAFVQAEFRVARDWRDHGYGAVVAEPKENAGSQKKLRLTYLRL